MAGRGGRPGFGDLFVFGLGLVGKGSCQRLCF